jgi:hypothetical protein
LIASPFQAQVDTLVRLGYPQLLGMTAPEFQHALAPLQSVVLAESGTTPPDPSLGHLPFVLVIRSALAPVERTLALLLRRGKPAVERLFPKTPADFKPIDSVALPRGEAYLLREVDRGEASLNVTPDDAHRSMLAAHRSPLTMEEGVAVLTQFPEFLQPNHCFSLLASRCGDKRVPALWLSEGRPKLGWCWAGNPHTWLGSASCAARQGSVELTPHAVATAG